MNCEVCGEPCGPSGLCPKHKFEWFDLRGKADGAARNIHIGQARSLYVACAKDDHALAPDALRCKCGLVEAAR